MTHKIIKFPSGFYGLVTVPENTIVKADLIPWDGKRGTDYPHDLNNQIFEYYIDARNTVYYTDHDGINARIWCSGKELNRHCHHLAQIAARR